MIRPFKGPEMVLSQGKKRAPPLEPHRELERLPVAKILPSDLFGAPAHLPSSRFETQDPLLFMGAVPKGDEQKDDCRIR